jgi:hypothetical protein
MANTLKFKRGLLAGLPTAAEGEPLFTTDTKDLYIGTSTGNQRFQKYIASGATTQILRGDGSLYSFPLAISSPSNGQVLKFNGTNWVNDSDAGITGSGSSGQVAYFSGATTQAGSNNLFWDSTNNRLGILTNSPATSFHINSGSTTQGGAIFGKGSYNYATVSQVGSAADAIFGGGVIASATSGEVAKTVGDVGHYIKIQIGDGITFHTNITGTTGTSLSRSTNERVRIFPTTGNFGINTGSSDTGQRLQVNGTAYFSNSLAIASATYAYEGLSLRKNLTGLSIAYGVVSAGTIQSDVTTAASYYESNARTQAATFTVSALYHFNALQVSFGAGSTVSSQYGFFANSSLIGATNNYGFFGDIPSGTNRWNLFMNGSAPNYINGSLGIGTTSTSGARLSIGGSGTEERVISIFKTLTGGTSRYGILQFNTINSDVTSSVLNNYSQFVTQAATFTLTHAYHYYNADISMGAGSTITNQYGYFAASIQAATNNFGFYGNLVAGTGRWNLYMNGNASNYFAGKLLLGSTTDTTEMLQVNGTAKVTGTATFGSTIVASGLISATTEFRLNNNTFTRIAKIDASGGYAGGYNLDYSSGGVVTHAATGSIAGMRYETGGATLFFNNTSQSAGTTGTESMRIHATRNVSIGSGGDTGEKFQVTGTGKFTDSTTFTKAYVNTSDLGVIISATVPGINLRSTSQGRTSFIQNYNANGMSTILTGTGTNNPTIQMIHFNSNDSTVIVGSWGGTSSGDKLQVIGNANISNKLLLGAGTTSNAQINLASSTAPTSPNNGDIWFDGTDLKMRIGGVTKTFTLV